MVKQQHHHFLVVTFAAQGHINPARHLAKRLVRTTPSRVTFSTSVSAHRRMFPSSADHDDVEEEHGLITYSPYSDGFDAGFADSAAADPSQFMSRIKLVGSRTLSHLARTLAARGRPVTCVIYTILLSWAADVARDLAVPSVAFWVQPATVFAIFHHYFHGYSDLISSNKNNPSFPVKLPGLPPLRIMDLPCFLTAPDTDVQKTYFLSSFEEMFRTLDSYKTKQRVVLVNTFDALESDAISAVDGMDLIAIGPMVDADGEDRKERCDLFEEDRKGYMEWLETKADGSVVYVAFGSFAMLTWKQMEEISSGLKESGRPYLWVVRKENRRVVSEEEEEEMGMVVEWCSQVRVLSHRSIGCFVTHCGWNSTVESVVCGVPTVGLPQGTEQVTNARMVEKEWGFGVRGEVNGEGVVEGRELRRCLDLVMGRERGEEMRRKAGIWRERAREAVGEGGSSDRNLRAFCEGLGED